MKILRRIDILYFISLFVFLFISMPVGPIGAVYTGDQNTVTSGDMSSDTDQDKQTVSGSYFDRISECTFVQADKTYLSVSVSYMPFVSLSHMLSILKSCAIVKIIMLEVCLHSQNFLHTFFHPPKIFMA